MQPREHSPLTARGMIQVLVTSDLQLVKFAVTLKSSSTAFFDAASEAREIEDDDDGNALTALCKGLL